MALALPLVRLLTYNAWADGDWQGFWGETAVAAGLAAIAGVVVFAQLPSRSHTRRTVALIVAIGVLIPSTITHVLRLAYPPSAASVITIDEDFSREGSTNAPASDRWITDLAPGAVAEVQRTYLMIYDPPGVTGFVDLRMPETLHYRDRRFWLPRGLQAKEYDELLEWEASARPERPYLVLLTTKNVQLQITPSGLEVNTTGGDGTAMPHRVALPEVGTGVPHRYRLERTDGIARLRVNDAPTWVALDTGPWQFVRFGESRADPDHGGRFLLDNVRYQRRYHVDQK